MIFVTLLSLTAVILLMTAGQSAIDIQLHDTYLVLDKLSLIILTIGPLAFLSFFLLGIRRRFNTFGTNIGFIIGLILISYICFQIALAQKNFTNQVRDNFGYSALPGAVPEREKLIKEMDVNLMVTRGLFGICIVGIGVIGYRSYRLIAKQL